jgi:NAD(P)H-dependent FMN reductase
MSINPAPLKLEIILGSVREGRFGPTVGNWYLEQARQHDGFEVGYLDLAEYQIPNEFGAHPDKDEFARRLEAADAVVIITPEYNHTFPGYLKTAIDAVPKSAWTAKPVAFVSYGGMSGGLRAVEPLRVVFPEIHAMTIRETVSFHGARDQFTADGQPVNPDGVNTAARLQLNQLEWWALALRDARALRPYGQKVTA